MLPYWVMFMLPALAAIFPQKSDLSFRYLLLVSLGVFYVFLIGFRIYVGGDWGSYIRIYSATVDATFLEAIAITDVAYAALNWVFVRLGIDIYGVNLVCAALFVSGAFSFARKQPLPWLAIAVVVPYLMIVVAMGYTRQSAALGIIFWGLSTLREGHVRRYVVIIVMAALFHKTALLMLPFGFLVGGHATRLSNIIILGGIGVLFFIALIQAHYEHIWHHYVDVNMVSEGGAIRLWMNLAAAITMFVFWKRWKNKFPDYRFWFWIAVVSFICLLLVDFASAAVDRVALYLAPLQVVVFSRLPVLIHDILLRTTAVVAILMGYAAVLWVWLNLAGNSFAWLPYQNVLFQ